MSNNKQNKNSTSKQEVRLLIREVIHQNFTAFTDPFVVCFVSQDYLQLTQYTKQFSIHSCGETEVSISLSF